MQFHRRRTSAGGNSRRNQQAIGKGSNQPTQKNHQNHLIINPNDLTNPPIRTKNPTAPASAKSATNRDKSTNSANPTN